MYRVLVRLAEIDPGDLNVQNNLAQISLLLNADPERARKLAADLYAKEPSNAAYVSTYAFSLHTKGDSRNAARIMSGLRDDQLENPSLAAYYGIVLAAAGETTKARKYIEIGRKAHLLSEEKALIGRAEALSKYSARHCHSEPFGFAQDRLREESPIISAGSDRTNSQRCWKARPHASHFVTALPLNMTVVA